MKYLSYVSMAKANNLSHDWLKFPTTSLHHSPGKQFFSFFRPWDKDRFMAPDIEAVLKLVKKGKVCAEVYSRADWKQTGSMVTQWLTQGWKQLVCIHQCPITILLTTLLYLTIRLWALDFYCEIVDKGKARIKHRT